MQAQESCRLKWMLSVKMTLLSNIGWWVPSVPNPSAGHWVRLEQLPQFIPPDEPALSFHAY